MLDFKKLMARSLEEREVDAARYQAEEQARLAAEQLRLDERIRSVAVLAEVAEAGRLTEFEAQFVCSMAYRAQTYDFVGRLCGRLLDLSAKELPIFERLVSRHVAAVGAVARTSSSPSFSRLMEFSARRRTAPAPEGGAGAEAQGNNSDHQRESNRG